MYDESADITTFRDIQLGQIKNSRDEIKVFVSECISTSINKATKMMVGGLAIKSCQAEREQHGILPRKEFSADSLQRERLQQRESRRAIV
jgi:hypothetical protein